MASTAVRTVIDPNTILQHKCEHDEIYPQLEKWTRNMATWYAEAVDA